MTTVERTTTDTDPPPEACARCGTRSFRVDPTLVGRSCGWLWLEGAYVCDGCGAGHVARGISKPAEVWSLASSGRSLDVGSTRLRAEKGLDDAATRALFVRLSRLPSYERALRRLAAIAPPELAAIATAALDGRDLEDGAGEDEEEGSDEG